MIFQATHHVEVYTARLGYRGPLRWLDVSLQGNMRRADAGKVGGQDGIGLLLAPPPELLYPYLSKRKFGRLTAEDWPRYVAGYSEHMRKRYRDPVTRPIFDRLLELEHLVLLCYCTKPVRVEAEPDSGCHRVVLAEILVKLGAVYLGELEVAVGAKPIPAPGEMVVGQGGGCLPVVINEGTHADPQFVGGIVCRGRGHRKRCAHCKNNWRTKQCDYPLTGATRGKTCDMDLCGTCAVSIDEQVDYCPAHAKMARAAAEEQGGL